ncbi:helix-turn-helix transcriptional regulator [Pseudoalteromonas sp.]|uniref:helix-turn-helix transcriptional regulator n=1 Tax=Pseudoalteromonas sp. TaxID=53249 RepID=UPI003563A4D5
MALINSSISLGIVGSAKDAIISINNSLVDKVQTRVLDSLESIHPMRHSLGAIAYVMESESKINHFALEHIYQQYAKIPLYIICNHISIPLLHHAIKMRVRDVLVTPITQHSLNEFVDELIETTQVSCYPRSIHPSQFIESSEQLINHPLGDLFDIIEQHYVDGPSLQQVSSNVYLSPSRISHMFKDLCGIGYCQYILCRRIEESERLLMQPNVSITQVASDTGFANSSHFCRSFKEHVGITPSAYIRNDGPINLSCLYQRYQKLRMELLPKQHQGIVANVVNR